MEFVTAYQCGYEPDPIDVPVSKIQGVTTEDDITYIYACGEWLRTEKTAKEIRLLIMNKE